MAETALVLGFFLFAAATIALLGAILGLGLRGRFAIPPAVVETEPDQQIGIIPSNGDSGLGLFVSPDRATSLNAEAPPTPTSTNGAAIETPSMTTGTCMVSIQKQEDRYLEDWCYDVTWEGVPVWGDPRHPACYPLGVPPWHPTNNIVTRLPNPATCAVAISDTWTIAGWYMTYVQLAPGAVFEPPPQSSEAQYMLKVIRGSVLNAGQTGILRDDGQWETFSVTPPMRVTSLRVPYTTQEITAGSDGAVFAWFVVPQHLMDTPVVDMFSPPATMVAGPFAELLEWRTFADRAQDTFFTGNFWNMPGILVQNFDGSYLNYNQWWTIREDDPVDGGYHDHSGQWANNTFGELHLTLYAATASAGMQSLLPNTQNLLSQPNPDPVPTGQEPFYANNDRSEVQIVMPIPPGSIHGPIWAVERSSGLPVTNCNGAVVYPWHRLVTGTNPNQGISSYHTPPRYSLWMPFEIPPKYLQVPLQMLAQWDNAYLQNEDGNYPANCP